MKESAGGIVLGQDGKIVLVSQNGDSWSLPKGHVDEGESHIEAAKREVYEESGVVDLTLVRELGVYERYRLSKDGGDDLSEPKRITMFLFKTVQKNLKPVDPDNPEARWVSVDEALNLLTHRKDKEFLKSVRSIIETVT
jgi:ADP-ribose pyrophosphatase YjhB (NUDIX family)